MATNDFGITCPQDCATTTFGAIEVIDPNCPPKPRQSEITDFLFMHPVTGVGPADWTSAADWSAAINNADATDVAVKRFSVIGSKPEPERPDIPVTNFKVIKGDGTYTLELDIPYLPQQTYDLLRRLQCGSTQLIFWYKDAGGLLYGKQEGIDSSSVSVEFPHETGKDSYTVGKMVVTWDAVTEPERIESPF